MKMIGDESSFALGFELRADPDEGGDPAERASWGALQVWVAGRNLTAGRADGVALDAAEVPLLPVVRWLVERWDPLLHEERLPRPSYAGTAASWRMDCLDALFGREDDLDRLLEERHAWWHRHGLGSALPEFRVPDLHIRRAGSEAELSWDDREWRTVPRGVRLVESPGAALLPVEQVARVLFDWSTAVVGELGDAPHACLAARDLEQRLVSLERGHRRLPRLKWAAGQALDQAAGQLRQLLGVTSGTLEETVESLLGAHGAERPGLVAHLTVPALLFRSANPRLTTADLEALMRLAIAVPEAPDGRNALANLQEHRPPPFGAMAITEDGYERALELRHALGIEPHRPLTGDTDLERILMPRLGVRVVDVRLDDSHVDGIAVVSSGRVPLVAVNLSGRFSRTPWGRRMTLAHELCHLLYDLDSNGMVGVVSNPWAPQVLERRANAFAAMFLMPPDAVRALLPVEARDWTTDVLQAAMRTLGVGKSALTWHLYNLGLVSASEREAWLDEL
ncbi:ImmA/IrrE family metallo-endopeptidase [Paraliomyxa miuraensis]|uniref:ImmA/IrrE family metallo-endopeptidase n=1 Tax=Paraliomyxa miuraensis TaxID=376150 RepID=UPI00224E978F|nr:ImmA/IrrE family metallo-endopeptidase [Paraliomyxa miuraensis]MCX4244465.1 ImmA/IrrE family metallo-endopeptidase [Paraliomyxa miuraensis]